MAKFYFDHNACTPADPRVLERFQEVETTCPGNPGSLHAAGRRARGVIEDARCSVADTLRVEPEAVLFVSGGTEANNMAIAGLGEPHLPVLTSAAEHPSSLAAAERRGHILWPLSDDGTAVLSPPDREIGLVALTHGQNEVGTLQPIVAAAAIAREAGVTLHVDASQTLGRVPLDALVEHADSITFSTHKAGGLRGCGVLIDRHAATRPLLVGGGQQFDRRPGTESPALIAASALAFELAWREQSERARAMAAARATFLAQLDTDTLRVLTPEHSLPNTAMIAFGDVDGREVLPALDMAGVLCSQGSACSSGSPTPPQVLLAMGLSEAAARACVRFSFSQHTSLADAAEGGRVVNNVALGLHRRHNRDSDGRSA